MFACSVFIVRIMLFLQVIWIVLFEYFVCTYSFVFRFSLSVHLVSTLLSEHLSTFVCGLYSYKFFFIFYQFHPQDLSANVCRVKPLYGTEPHVPGFGFCETSAARRATDRTV